MLIRNLVGLKTPTINSLEKKNIRTTDELLRVIPRKYLDYREIVSLDDAVGKDCAIAGYVEKTVKDKLGNISMLGLDLIEETTGKKVHVKWFGQAFLWERIHMLNCKEIVICGKVRCESRGYEMSNPFLFCEKIRFHGKIIPVYTKMKGISEDMHRKLLKECVDMTEEPLEKEAIQLLEQTFPVKPYRSTMNAIHYPKDMESVMQAAERLRINDMLYFALKTQASPANELKSRYTIKSDTITERFLHTLPFELTKDQLETYEGLKKELMSGSHTKALIQGDVGCGKSMVAFLLMILMAENGFQSVLLAPTQVLAIQHYKELSRYMIPYGFQVACLTSNMTAKEKRAVLAGIENGDYLFIIGTHSTFSEKVNYHSLGLVITDEEHRFGLKQKTALQDKSNDAQDLFCAAHDIMMSATPIPRTMAEVIYGTERKIYEIKTMPPGRIPIQTAVNNSERVIYDFIEKQLAEGRQCYVVCPRIEETEGSSDTHLESIEETVKKYRERFEPLGYHIGMAVGTNKSAGATQDALAAFENNEIQILISTTVVEVGVNVPNANLIVINNAERFGLAQLHQLRGRVGRGTYKSYCILKSSFKDNERLQVMVNTLDGFRIAEEDLKLRGTGDLFGEEQTGVNKFIELILSDPKTYKKVFEIAGTMKQNGYGDNLLALYD